LIALNLGSGEIENPTRKTRFDVNPAYASKLDYINIDVQRLKGVHVLADARKLPFKNKCVEHVLVRHVLEHFGHVETQAVLTEWFRVLKQGGTLEVIVPNLAREFYKHPEWISRMLGDEDDGYHVAKSLFGGQRDRWDFHKNAFNFRYLRESLENAGFTKVRRDVSCYPYSLDKPYDLRVFASKSL
jgi:predicted SAM-dependent methyltransferase